MSRFRIIAGVAAAPALALSLAGPVSADDDVLPQEQYLLTAAEARAATKSVKLDEDTRTCWQQTLPVGGPATLCVSSYSWSGRVPKTPYPSEVSFTGFADEAGARQYFAEKTVPRYLSGFGLLGKATIVKQTATEVVFVYSNPPDRDGFPFQGFAARVINGIEFQASCVNNGVTLSKKKQKITVKQRRDVTQCLNRTLNAQIAKMPTG